MVKTHLAVFSNRNFSGICILENRNDACYACVLFTCFCFLLRLIYSALYRYMKLAIYADQLEDEKYV